MATFLWPTFSQILHRHELMDGMMQACGVDVLTAVRAGEPYVQARASCRDCLHEGDCRNWFLGDSGAAPDFCPNVDFFRACKREDR